MQPWQALLDYWFGEGTQSWPQRLTNQHSLWFGKSEATDRELDNRFGDLYEQALAGELESWRLQPESCLALIILLDQLSRNLFRDTPAAFAQDHKALQLTDELLQRQWLAELVPVQRVFALLPLEHSEQLARQRQAVAEFQTLYEEVRQQQPELETAFASFLDYAKRHQQVIERFGRFPHRNAILGRTNTPAEASYLAEPGAGF